MDPSRDITSWAETPIGPQNDALCGHQGSRIHARDSVLRYRTLRVAARLIRGARKLRLKIDHTWPCAPTLARAFHRLHALPAPTI